MSRFIYYFWPFCSSIIYMQKKLTSGQINNPWLTFRDVFKVGVSVETAEVDRGVSHMSSFQRVWISLLCVRQHIDTFVRRQKTTLMKSVVSYQPGCPDTSEARVLLLGPVGSGKSSFISSVQSVFNGRVINRAMVGSCSTSFTKKVNVTSELHPPGSGSPSKRLLLGPAAVLQNPRPEGTADWWTGAVWHHGPGWRSHDGTLPPWRPVHH